MHCKIVHLLWLSFFNDRNVKSQIVVVKRSISHSAMNENTQNFELNDDGICTSCDELSIDAELVQCAICKKNFHAVCTAAGADDKWATKSMILTYKSPSTKNNFMFLCNCCLTTMETNIADIDGQRIRRMERNMEEITKELLEIKKLLKPAVAPSTEGASVSVSTGTINSVASGSNTQDTGSRENQSMNIWNDADRLSTVKAKPAESVLIISKSPDSVVDRTNKDLVESTVIENKILVKKSFKSQNGNLVVVCDSAESRDVLKDQVTAANGEIEMRTPNEIRPVVSIVGLTKNYEKDEVIELLKQNYFLSQFAANNELQEHIKVLTVKPLKGNQEVFQAFVRVSKVVRQGFKTYKDKVTMGITSCKIYDQYQVKRCNNCQGFGHFYKNCPNPQTNVCAKCGENHATKNCISQTLHCVNCAKADLECDHSSDDLKCPSLHHQQEKLKTNLNMQR